jgi:hypothetical protein
MLDLHDQHVKDFYRCANKISRRNGYSKATAIVRGTANKVISRVNPGYRKYTSGEYVSAAYRKHFGWKNTYYQKAVTVVMIEG